MKNGWTEKIEKLEAENARLEARDEVWRAKKAMLENDLGAAWAENKHQAEEIVRLSVILNNYAGIAERVCREYAAPKAGYVMAEAIRKEANLKVRPTAGEQ